MEISLGLDGHQLAASLGATSTYNVPMIVLWMGWPYNRSGKRGDALHMTSTPPPQAPWMNTANVSTDASTVPIRGEGARSWEGAVRYRRVEGAWKFAGIEPIIRRTECEHDQIFADGEDVTVRLLYTASK